MHCPYDVKIALLIMAILLSLFTGLGVLIRLGYIEDPVPIPSSQYYLPPPPPPPTPWIDTINALLQLIFPLEDYAPGPHSLGVPCEQYLSLTGLDGIKTCLDQLRKYPNNRFEVHDRYSGASSKAICRRNVDGAETRIELNIDASHPAAPSKRMVPKWEIECVLRRRLQACASGLVEEPGEQCADVPWLGWAGELHVAFEVSETAPHEEL